MPTKISQQYRCLLDILTCLVCKQIVHQAHICPNCSKFYCLNCIIGQLAQEQKCMNCNRFLQVPMLVNCDILCQELKETLDKSCNKKSKGQNELSKKQILFCTSHRLQKNYYCKTCECPLCSDCSVLTEEHRGHQFIKLSIIKSNYEEKMSHMMDKIREVKKAIKKKLGLTEDKNSKRDISQQQNILSLETALKFTKESIKKKVKSIVNENDKIINKFQSLIQHANVKYKELLTLLKNCSKVEFVEDEYLKVAEELGILLREINKDSLQIVGINSKFRPMLKFQSYIQPNYQNYVFFIDDYSEKIEETQFFYTNEVKNSIGNIWRLKIYPKGIVNPLLEQAEIKLIKKCSKNQEYFAIFIELIDGPSKITKQKHQLILVNHFNQKKNFLRQYESEFDVGQCWGYEHFIKLNQLYSDGFYNQDMDLLEIRLNICPANYYQASLDQQNALTTKREILQNKKMMIQKLQQMKMLKERSTSSLIEMDDEDLYCHL